MAVPQIGNPLAPGIFGVNELNVADFVSFYAGYVASAFILGRILSGYAWGHLSDKIGRKPVMLVGLASTVVFSVAFGFSKTFTLAITWRFLHGLTTAIVPSVRLSVREVCGPEHVVMGMAIVGGSKAVALVLGTGIGGLLADPALQYPSMFSTTGLFGRYPFLLPNIFGSCFAAIMLVVVVFWLPETMSFHELPAAKPESTMCSETDGTSSNGSRFSSSTDVEDVPLSTIVPLDEPRWCGPNGCLSTPAIPVMFVLGFAVQGLIVGFEEVFPLWALSTPDVGGLGWDIKEIGKALLTVGIFLASLQLFCVPLIIRKVGVLTWQRGACVLGTAALLAFPNAKFLSWDHTSLFTICVGSAFFVNASISALMLVLTVASTSIVPTRLRGKFVGLYGTAESFGRFVAPPSYAVTYAYSISPSAKDSGWLDFRFVFYASATVLAGVSLLCWRSLTSDALAQPAHQLKVASNGLAAAATNNVEKNDESDTLLSTSGVPVAKETTPIFTARDNYGRP